MEPGTFLAKLEELKRKGWTAKLHGDKIRLFNPSGRADMFDPLTAVYRETRGIFYPVEKSVDAASALGIHLCFRNDHSHCPDYEFRVVYGRDGRGSAKPLAGVDFDPSFRRRVLEALGLDGV